MEDREFEEIAARLRAAGLDADAEGIDDLTLQLEAAERPPGVLQRVTAHIRGRAEHHWKIALAELAESKEAWRLVQERMRGRELKPDELDIVRTQMADALRTVPAGILTAATAMVPVPGAMLVSPMLLDRLGLMPSRWREAAALERLRKKSHNLRERGEVATAARLDEMLDAYDDRRSEQHEAARRTAQLTYWDIDGDGTISGREVRKYLAEVERLASLVPKAGAARRWYLQLGDRVFGPVRWGETLEAQAELPILVCLDGESGWVLLADVQAHAGWGKPDDASASEPAPPTAPPSA